MSGELVDTTEMYLKAIYELEEEGVPALRARLVDRLEQSKPTVSETVGRLERLGLLTVEDSRVISFSEQGREKATSVMRKHRLAECLLRDVIKFPWHKIHTEACRWENVMSDEIEQRFNEILSFPKTDPYGNLIPPVGTLGPEKPAQDYSLVTVEHCVKKNKQVNFSSEVSCFPFVGCLRGQFYFLSPS